ncbi:MAG: hypothetical protein FJX29_07340 [Alphaproteobacteria bacterium]|nr:hypothetical protein [Alphaproteobacteria bacterium]
MDPVTAPCRALPGLAGPCQAMPGHAGPCKAMPGLATGRQNRGAGSMAAGTSHDARHEAHREAYRGLVKALTRLAAAVNPQPAVPGGGN